MGKAEFCSVSEIACMYLLKGPLYSWITDERKADKFFRFGDILHRPKRDSSV